MKKFILPTLAALTLLNTPLARAWTYNSNNGDVLLIFRQTPASGSYNVEFDLGNVTNFLGKTNGYTTTVANWSLSYLNANHITLTDPTHPTQVALLATGGSTNWLSSSTADPNVTAYYQGSYQQAAAVSAAINGVGTRPLIFSSPSNSVNAYAFTLNKAGDIASYDYTVTGGNTADTRNTHYVSQIKFVGRLGGDSPFIVQQTVPAQLGFWQVGTTATYPGSPADKFIGTFNLDTNGVLTFVAGPPAPTVSLTRAGNTSTVSFTTTVGSTYNLAYTNQLGGAVSTWPLAGTTVTGDGNVDTITRTATGPVEFYRVSAQ